MHIKYINKKCIYIYIYIVWQTISNFFETKKKVSQTRHDKQKHYVSHGFAKMIELVFVLIVPNPLLICFPKQRNKYTE